MDKYAEILQRMKTLANKYGERFYNFYNHTWVMCHDLPPGQSFRIAEVCNEKWAAVFADIVALCIYEQPFNENGGMLAFTDETRKVVARSNLHHFKRPDTKQTNQQNNKPTNQEK